MISEIVKATLCFRLQYQSYKSRTKGSSTPLMLETRSSCSVASKLKLFSFSLPNSIRHQGCNSSSARPTRFCQWPPPYASSKGLPLLLTPMAFSNGLSCNGVSTIQQVTSRVLYEVSVEYFTMKFPFISLFTSVNKCRAPRHLVVCNCQIARSGGH